MSVALLGISPFGLLIIAGFLRIIATSQPESSRSDSRRALFNRISYFLLAVSIVGMIFLLFAAPPGGVIGLMLAAMLVGTLAEAEIRIAGVRKRARQVEFLWVLALAVKSGRPLADEIDAYATGTWGKRHRLLVEMAERLREGAALTEIIVPHGLLPRAAAMQIHVGISSKSLQESLQDTAVRYTQQLSEEQSSSHPGCSLMYPAALVPAAFAIVGFLMYYIIPKYKRIFDDFGTELPRITILLISLSDSVVNYWFLFGLPLIYVPLAIFAYVLLAEYHGWQSMSQSSFGRWFVRWHSPDIIRALSQGVTQGVPMDRALRSVVNFSGPLKLRQRLACAVDEIEAGSPNWQTLQRAGLVNYHETVLLETAQRTGNLPWVLQTLASNMERRWLFRFKAFLEFLQPALLIAVSMVIGFIALAMFMPLIKLLNDLS